MSRKMLQVPVATLVLLSLLQIADVAAVTDAATTATAAAATTSTMTTGIDASLKNAKLIEGKVLPDLAILKRVNQEYEKWQQVYRFIDDGFPVLELYGYKPKSGEWFGKN